VELTNELYTQTHLRRYQCQFAPDQWRSAMSNLWQLQSNHSSLFSNKDYFIIIYTMFTFNLLRKNTPILSLHFSALQKLYVPDEMTISEASIYLPKNPTQTIFERLWSPLLDVISMESSSANFHLATIDVKHETDCAYRCYTINECKAFIVTCKLSRKCNVRHCELMAGLSRIQI